MKSLVEDVRVAIPWFGRDPHREAALAWVARKWAGSGYQPMLGIPGVDHWVKALAARNAIEGSTAPILAICDADVWSDGIDEAIQRVRDGAPWAIPHNKLYRLDQEGTRQVLDGAEPHERMPLAELRPGMPGFPYQGQAGGGIVVMRRDVWDDCPLDPRFTGWALEDGAWDLALRCLYGPPVRLKHPLWHLWHPPQEHRGVGTPESSALHKRYARAKRRPELMRALIDEAR